MSEIFGSKKNLGSNKIAGPKIFGPKNFLGLKIILGLKKFEFKEVWFKNILVHKKYCPRKIGSKDLVKIGSVTAEIL